MGFLFCDFFGLGISNLRLIVTILVIATAPICAAQNVTPARVTKTRKPHEPSLSRGGVAILSKSARAAAV
jgi:hypothetical protein